MRSAARAIVIQDDKLLVIKRFKLGKTYYSLPGGQVESGETPQHAALRETMEETTLRVSQPRLVFVEEAGDPFGPQHVFLCKFEAGQPHLPEDSEEAYWSVEGKNTYEAMWLPVKDLPGVQMVSHLLKEALLDALANGFPDEPRHFENRHADRLS